MIGRKISLSEGKTYVLMDSLGGTTVAKDLEKALSAGMTVLGSIEPQQSISTFSSSSAVVRRTGSGTAKDGVSEFSPKSSLAGYETVPSNMKGAALSSSKRPTINGTKVAEAYAYVPPPPPYAGVTDEDDCIFKGANGNYYSQNTMSPSNMYPKYSVTGYSRSLFPNYERVCWVPFEGRWFLYWEEKTVNVKVYSNHSKAQSPTSVKPYQKFSLTLSGSCTLDEFEVDSDGGTRETTQLTYSSLSAAVELFGMNANADVLDGSETHLTNPDYVWSRSASDELQSSHQDYAIDYGGFSIEIQVEGWDEEYYAVEKKAGQSAAVYAGKAVGQAFADGYTLVHYAENDYKTLSDVVQTSLSLDGITPQTFSEGDAVGFSYSYSGEAVQYVSNDKVIGLAAGSAKFDLMTRRTSYKVGETIKLSEIDIKSAGHLKYSDGTTIAICPRSLASDPDEAERTMRHEAGGHGFGKLADESVLHGDFIDDCNCSCCLHADEIRRGQARGWYQNISLTGKLHEVPWAHLLQDSRYSSRVDIYEGGAGHARGVYRSEPNSCMNNGGSYFNAISREAIVKRIMTYAGETYDYDSFVANDKTE